MSVVHDNRPGKIRAMNVSADGPPLYVTNGNANSLQVIDVRRLSEILVPQSSPKPAGAK